MNQSLSPAPPQAHSPDDELHGEQWLRQVIEAAPNAMLLVDAAGHVVLVNAQAERLFGYPRSELLGQPVEMLVPQRLRERHVGDRSTYAAMPSVRAMGAGRDLYGLRKDGTELAIEIGLNPIDTAEGHLVLASVIDITARRLAAAAARSTHADSLRQSIFESLPFSVVATDIDGRMISANPATEQMLGYTCAELIGQPVLMLHDPAELRQTGAQVEPGKDASGFRAVFDADGPPPERECVYRHREGLRMAVNLAVSPMRDNAGRLSGYLHVAYDITERKRAEAFVRHMAHHDGLTGLPNRTLLMDRLDRAISQAERQHEQFVVLALDLDHFKRVNDTLGHPVGDQFLLTISRRLQRTVRAVDTVARVGGDEFAVVLTDVRDRRELAPVVAQIAKAVSDPVFVDGRELMVTPSIGGCLFPEDGTDAETLLKHADTAMYQAKSRGRSNLQWFTKTMRRQNEQKMQMSAALRRAIDRKELTLQYQAEVSARSGLVIGAEALLRWRQPGRGAVSPDRFIPVAEETGMILELGEWVLRTACSDCVDLQQKSGRDFTLSVNVSPRQFQQHGWLGLVEAALDQSGLAPNRLELEITEGLLMHNPTESAAVLHRLRDLGVVIVVDDFGTGYSSLAYLARFPIDKIKIDRSFVRNLAASAPDAGVVNAVIVLAQSLNLRVIAEGVETVEQLDYLRTRGCDEVQGFLFGESVQIADFPALVQRIETQGPPASAGTSSG